MLRALIVDDEPLARDELTYILRRTKRVDVAGEAENMEDAYAQIGQLMPDVVFLDIQLAEGSGLDLAKQLLSFDRRPEIVFATAYDEYALKAFELEAVDYILKPFDEYRIQQTVEKLCKLNGLRDGSQPLKALQKFVPREQTDKLAITAQDRILLVNICRILYISSVEGKTVIVTEDAQYTVSDSLVTFEQKLHNSPIVRVHRAFLVNLDGIVEIQPWFHSTYNLIMKDGSKVPVSRTHMKELKQLIGF
ncbi:LytTR family transcriptional regulator DNA-binding domain-containing protein [Paenibacillus sp. sptzw28]|uniref:LytR/AlgR family response regulator transcription factor n=1 Tax=Paenibacillus sp. sptzw28 TaxID=715179 RepID=UPI001C6E0EFC|nr:LytTR family transcriptional regulator DNA-binding domain-containing protein [Paenibacillus sp. sptzw28]QYR23192.1 LytTR family transcriptional regulator DNA-binding domain-containing protein [Paenibacillus sp. sptzw28]